MKFSKIKLTKLHLFLILLVVLQLPLFDKVVESFSAYKEGMGEGDDLTGNGPGNFGGGGGPGGPGDGGPGDGGPDGRPDGPTRGPAPRRPAARGPAARGPVARGPAARGPAARGPSAAEGGVDVGMILKIVLGVGVVAFALNYYKSSGRKKLF